MFYHLMILGQRGPLAKIWLAAHYDRKLARKEVITTNIAICVNSIINSRLPLSLRTASHLLLGVTKLLHKQTNYLLKDLEHAAFFLEHKTKSIDLPKSRKKYHLKDITLKEKINFNETFELIPEPPLMNEFHLKSHLDKNKLIEELNLINFTDPLISVLENYVTQQDYPSKINLEDLDKPLKDNGFGEPYGSNIDNLFMEVPQNQSFQDVPTVVQDEPDFEPSKEVDQLQRLRKVSFDVEIDLDLNKLKIDDLKKSLSSIEVGRDSISLTEFKDQNNWEDYVSIKKSIEIARRSSMRRSSVLKFQRQPLILEPLAIDDKVRKEKRKKKPRRLIIDHRLVIDRQQFLERLHSYNDTIGMLHFAPFSRKIIRLLKQGSIQSMSQFMRNNISKTLKKSFQHHFYTQKKSFIESEDDETQEAWEKKSVPKKVEIEIAKELKNDTEKTFSVGEGRGTQISKLFEEMPLQEPIEEVLFDIPEIAITQHEKKEESTKSSKKRSRKGKLSEVEEELSPKKRTRLSSIGQIRASTGSDFIPSIPGFETFIGENSILLENTIRDNLYQLLIEAISKTSFLTFSMLVQNKSRFEAAIMFYFLLLLHHQRRIKMEQNSAYEEIYIYKETNFEQFC